MDERDMARSFLARFESWINRPAAIPLKPGQKPEDEEPVWIFDWYAIGEAKREDILQWIFGDAEGTLPTLFETVVRQTPFGPDEVPVLKPGWLPFGLLMVDLEGAREMAVDNFNTRFPSFSQLLLVNLLKHRGPTIPVYCIDIDGTVIPAAEPALYLADVSELKLCEPGQ